MVVGGLNKKKKLDFRLKILKFKIFEIFKFQILNFLIFKFKFDKNAGSWNPELQPQEDFNLPQTDLNLRALKPPNEKFKPPTN